MGVKVTSLTEQEILAIGDAFADHPYPADDQGMAELFPSQESIRAYICCYVRAALKCGCLYATSDRHEAFLTMRYSQDKGHARFMLALLPGMLRTVGLRGMLRYVRLTGRSGTPYRDELEKAGVPHIYVGMLAVTKPYQGQGFMRRVIEIAYEEGRKWHCPVVLETDARLKRDKYVSVGMTCVRERPCTETAAMFDMVKEFD